MKRPKGGYNKESQADHETIAPAMDHQWPLPDSQFVSMAENATDIIARFDRNLRTIYCNPATARQSGRPLSDFLGKTPLETGAPQEVAAMIDRDLRRVLESGKEEEVEQVVPGPGGPRCLLTRIIPEKGESGRLESLLVISRDVTEYKRMESALRRVERLAAMGVFATGVAHEINNPVGAATLAIETALSLPSGKGRSEKQQACMRNALAALERCAQIVRDLLRLSRGEPGPREWCQVCEILQRALTLNARYAENRGVRLALEAQPGPQAQLHPLEMELAVANLVRNAILAISGEGTVTVRLREQLSGVEIDVIDDGCGMTPDQQQAMFDPFFTTRQGAGGTGLGASIAHQIIQEHGGTIRVQTAPGQGTVVTIALPFAGGTCQFAGHPIPEAPLPWSTSSP